MHAAEIDQLLETISRNQKQMLLDLLGECSERGKYIAQTRLFPDTGPLCRSKYGKQVQFMAKGAEFNERILFGGNRSGKTVSAAYELTCHLTGEYPHWWEGRRFYEPVRAWAVGKTNNTTRDIIQAVLLGPIFDMGSGLIPKDSLLDKNGNLMVTTAPGVPGAKQDAYVKHKSGGLSSLGFKSYAQERASFEGTSQHVIWMDEEPPIDIYSECLTRTMTTDGLLMVTETPLDGLSKTVMQFLPNGEFPRTANGCGPVTDTKWLSRVEWDDVPHLSEKRKKAILASYLPHENEARSKGIPTVGSGKVYPIPESDFLIPPFEIPDYWPRVVGLDVGWKTTAAVWAAIDEANDTVYIYREYKVENQLPVMHAAAIRRNTPWIPIVVDPAASALRIKKDGPSMFREYAELGMDMFKANNSVDVGILNVLNRLSTNRLKVFNCCPLWLNEFRIYRRNDRQEIVKELDDLQDATRYLIMSGLQLAITKPDINDEDEAGRRAKNLFKLQGKNSITGY